MPDSKSTLVSRNITVLGRRTSVRLEPEMWDALNDIARREKCKIHDICSLIGLRKHPDSSLTAAIRVFLMLYYKAAATEQGHKAAGHGNFDIMVTRARTTLDILRDKGVADAVKESGNKTAVANGEVSSFPDIVLKKKQDFRRRSSAL